MCIFTLFGCKTEENLTPENPNPFSLITSTIPGVYVVGEKFCCLDTSKFFKNTDLIYSIPNSEIKDIFISGNDIYMVGFQREKFSTVNNATIWKNGLATLLGSNRESSQANSIFISKEDIYVSGFEFDLKRKKVVPTLWKNGNPMTIEVPFNLDLIFLFVEGNDVYTCGVGGDSKDQTYGSYFFKNGKQIFFEKLFSVTGLFVTNGNVYACGNGNNESNRFTVAKIWKNGVFEFLENNKSRVNDIFISGKDVYAVGFSWDKSSNSDNSIMWKNSKVNKLSGSYSIPKSIFVSQNDIFIIGNIEILEEGKPVIQSTIWKNNIKLNLPKSFYNMILKSIFVVK